MSLFKFGFTKASAGASEQVDDAMALSSESDESSPKAKRKRQKSYVRNYDPSYLKYGFVSNGDQPPLPLCVVCNKTLTNESMKPALLLRHLGRMHADVKDKPIEYFERLKSATKDQINKIGGFTQKQPAATRASFRIAYRIARCKKPFNIGETLIKPSLMDATEEMFGLAATTNIEAIPLSANTIGRRVTTMALDIQEQMCDQIKKSGFFALQFDESTDVSNEAILMGFVRYVHESKIVEEMFCFCSMPNRTTGEQLFRAIDEKFVEYNLSWKNVVGVCTDGAPAMQGSRRGLVTRIAQVANESCRTTHCLIHREALAAKELSADLNETLNTAIKIVNSIKSKPLNCRVFAEICAELGTEHEHLLFHSDVRWLSRGKVLSRLYELLHELSIFMTEHKKTHGEYLNYLNDNKWKVKLAYLADIFSLLNDLNLQLQGKDMNCFAFMNRIDAFQKKLALWETKSKALDLEMFPLVSEMVSQNVPLSKYIAKIIAPHLKNMIAEFKRYFPADGDPRQNHLWIANPFVNADEPNTLTVDEAAQLLGKLIFSYSSLLSYFPTLFCPALKLILSIIFISKQTLHLITH